MTLFLNYNDFIYISNNDSILIFNSRSNETILLNTLNCSLKLTNFVAISISEDGSFFSACDDEKTLFIFNTDNWTIKNKITVNKRITCMVFTKKNNILLADKAGDVYKYSLDENNLKFVMGHVSILLHITLCKNDTFLITCDRDEKIRVSHYPDCFDIQEYCLFHTDFVSQVVYLENHDLLVSGSGDGFLALWDYIHGSVLDSIDCLPILSENCPNQMDAKVCKFSLYNLNEVEDGVKGKMERKAGDDGGENRDSKGGTMKGATNKCRGCDVKKIVYFKEFDVIAVAFERWDSVLIFCINVKKFIFVQKLIASASILDLGFNKNQLFVVQELEDEILLIFNLSKKDDNLIITSSKDDQDRINNAICKNNFFLTGSRKMESAFASLHKVHIDNIAEYVERKRKRISENKEKHSKQIKECET